MQHADVLIFVEDPGAANYLAQLPTALKQKRCNVKLIADGLAKKHLRQLGLFPDEIGPLISPAYILSTVKPHLLVIGTAGNPDTLGLALVDEARKNNIESIGALDAPLNAIHRFSGRTDNPLAYVPDWLMVVDKWTKDIFVSLGYPAQRIVVCGHPHYDYVRSVKNQLEDLSIQALRKRLLPGLHDGQKVVVFTTEGSASLTSMQSKQIFEYTLKGKGAHRGRTEVAIEEFLFAIKFVEPRPYLVLRLHPKDTQNDYNEYLNEFDLVSEDDSPFELIYASDLVVGLTTTMLLEAVLIGRATLSILPRKEERDYLTSIRNGFTPYVTTRKELKSILLKLLTGTMPFKDIKDDGVFVFGALQRIADFTEYRLKCASRKTKSIFGDNQEFS